MAYAHAFRYAPQCGAFGRAWPRMVADAARILGYLASSGLVLRSRTGYGLPEIDRGPDGVIAFNGGALRDESRQALIIRPTVPDRRRDPLTASRYVRDGYVTGYCDTGRAPYDVAVTAVLLRCHLLAPTAFTIDGAGDWDTEWLHGVTPTPGGLASPVPVALAARTVIARLFQDVRTPCPFTSAGPTDRDPGTASITPLPTRRPTE